VQRRGREWPDGLWHCQDLRDAGGIGSAGSRRAGHVERLVLVAFILTWGGMTAGCNRERKETERLLTETVQSYNQLQPKLTDLKTRLGGLRKEVEDLANKVPGGPELRATYLNADEALGVLDAKVKWLSGEIQSAKYDLKKARLVSLRKEIRKTKGNLWRVSDVVLELMHRKARLQQLAALLKAPYEHQLSTGYQVKAAEEGVESHLIGFIEDPNKKVDTKTWFDFDRLRLVDGGTQLDIKESRSQIENVAQILRAYPAVKLKIGGYADGAAAAKLSTERASAVKKALVQSGVNAHRLKAQGYGSRHPTCRASDSEDCKARVAVLVTAK
jgi:outer membrane protein OmpA-like peptidoglycan-associated protein